MEQEQFDIACLRGLATDADARRIALSAAMIKVLAFAIARQSPELREDALEIVGHVTQLYRVMPTRSSIRSVLDAHLSRPDPQGRNGPRSERSREEVVEALWRHFQTGAA